MEKKIKHVWVFVVWRGTVGVNQGPLLYEETLPICAHANAYNELRIYVCIDMYIIIYRYVYMYVTPARLAMSLGCLESYHFHALNYRRPTRLRNL